MTALGDLEISEWREMIIELIAYRNEQELQKQIYEWCAEHTLWLHEKKQKSQIMHWNAMLQRLF